MKTTAYPSLPLPTPEVVRDEVRTHFDTDRVAQSTEDALIALLNKFPHNTDPAHVLLKVVAINRLYNTQIFAVHDVARCIAAHNIDAELAEGSLNVVSKIAPVTIKDKVRNNFSFASKYCSWHNPEAYPIYDRNVDACLCAYKLQYRFADFSRQALCEYPAFFNVVCAFREHFSLTSLSFKELDKFLWVKGRELLTE